MSCRFTTCLDSRKTGFRVQQEVFREDTRKYAWGVPDCFRSVDEGDERSQRGTIVRDKGLGPFILDILKDFGDRLAKILPGDYENLRELPGATRFTADCDLLGPYQKIKGKISEMELLPGVYLKELGRNASTELRRIESHVEDMKAEWANIFRTASKTTQTAKVVDLRRKFESGPDVPHLTHLGDIPEIRASYAYRRYGADKPSFAFSMAFDMLCKIKARESGGTTLSHEFGDLMTIPKVAVRTLSALRSDI
jgi:RNA-dependent RNA polymerase